MNQNVASPALPTFADSWRQLFEHALLERDPAVLPRRLTRRQKCDPGPNRGLSSRPRGQKSKFPLPKLCLRFRAPLVDGRAEYQLPPRESKTND
jgi:hypothetical protein